MLDNSLFKHVSNAHDLSPVRIRPWTKDQTLFAKHLKYDCQSKCLPFGYVAKQCSTIIFACFLGWTRVMEGIDKALELDYDPVKVILFLVDKDLIKK